MGKEVRMEDGSVFEVLQTMDALTNRLVNDVLGSGGQGTVYRVKSQSDGKTYALKTYTDPLKKEFVDNLRNNIVKGAPHPAFVWPKMITEPLGENRDRYGYVMEIYGKEYVSFPAIIQGRASFPSKEVQLATLIEMCDAFEALHTLGYSYQDLNDGGIVFDCANGKVRICDNDNVSPYGVNLGILGKFKYMAPEVAIKMFMPDKHSDRFSLAVLMFYFLCFAHPFDGAKRLFGQLTAQLQERIYGTEPVFIFHPSDKSNRPDSVLDKNALIAWPLLPDFIQELFIKTFTSGMPYIGRDKEEIRIERQQRVTEKEWREAIYRWMDTMITCPHCHKSACLPIGANGKLQEGKCQHCNKRIDLKLPVLLIKRKGKVERTIVLEDGKKVSKNSVIGEKSNEVAFVVQRSKKVADIYGIKNLFKNGWRCSQAGSKDRIVNTDEIVPALSGVNIEFNYDYVGEIVI